MARVHTKNLNFIMNRGVFTGNDLISVFDLLTRFVNDPGMLLILEEQAFISLPTILADPGKTQFRTNIIGAFHYGRITCWLKAIQ